MTNISTGRQRGIVPFVDETTGRLPDQYIPQKIIDLQGDLEQAVNGFGLQAGTTTTGEPGTDAAVEIEKTGTKYTANFTIPRGEKGEQGPQGPKGEQGPMGDVTHAAIEAVEEALRRGTSTGRHPNPRERSASSATNR